VYDTTTKIFKAVNYLSTLVIKTDYIANKTFALKNVLF